MKRLFMTLTSGFGCKTPSVWRDRTCIDILFVFRGKERNIRTFQTPTVRKPHEIEILRQFIPKTSVLIFSSRSRKRIIHRESRSASCSVLRRLNSRLWHTIYLFMYENNEIYLKLFTLAVCSFSYSWVSISITCESYYSVFWCQWSVYPEAELAIFGPWAS